MRESNYSFPPQNRAVLAITHLLYDRRALDTDSPLAILNNLTSLTYLTSTSPRIREILTLDGGLERLLDILRESCLPRYTPQTADLWGLNGPPTARNIKIDQQVFLRHSLAFQCVVNIGVRGSESIRTRVVQAGALDLVAQILESWLVHHGIYIFAGALGSQAAIDAVAAGIPVPGTEGRRSHRSSRPRTDPETPVATIRSSSAAQSLRPGPSHTRPTTAESAPARPERSVSDTDVEMADVETDGASAGVGDDSMETDDALQRRRGSTLTVSAEASRRSISVPSRPSTSRGRSQGSSTGASISGDDNADASSTTTSDRRPSLQPLRPPALNLSAARLPQLAQDPASNQSSPMGTPTRQEAGAVLRPPARRGTIVGRPLNLAPVDRGDASGASDGGDEVDLQTATIAAGIAAATAQAREGGTVVPEENAPAPNVEIVETLTGVVPEEPDPEQMAAEQARLDMEAGAPPGQPGAAQTPRVPPGEAPTPQQALPEVVDPPAQMIIASGAPRGFHDLHSYVGVASTLNPEGDRYSDDSVLLALQLLAYLSKYPHVRSAFHNPRQPMHPTFNLKSTSESLPERPATSRTSNVFSLVERFTFRPSPSDPTMMRIPGEIQYWSGVIMRNACRKDEVRGGIRQCAHMSCGKWEDFPREFAKCRRCRKAKYCSKDCQSKAWSEGHRFWCSTRGDEPVPGVGGGGDNGNGGGGGGGGGGPGGSPPDRDDDSFPTNNLPPNVLARARAGHGQTQERRDGETHMDHSANGQLSDSLQALLLRDSLSGQKSSTMSDDLDTWDTLPEIVR